MAMLFDCSTDKFPVLQLPNFRKQTVNALRATVLNPAMDKQGCGLMTCKQVLIVMKKREPV